MVKFYKKGNSLKTIRMVIFVDFKKKSTTSYEVLNNHKQYHFFMSLYLFMYNL